MTRKKNKIPKVNELSTLKGVHPLPIFWASVSSVKTNLSPIDYCKIIHATKYPYFLVSAYDINKMDSDSIHRLTRIISEYNSTNMGVLIDSGNYESHWMRDRTWTSAKHKMALRMVPESLSTTFDNVAQFASRSKAIDKAKESLDSLKTIIKKADIIPIVHGNRHHLPWICKEISKHSPAMICVAERELGQGMISRIMTIKAIRSALNNNGYYTPLHILGTGNPLSLLLFSAAGADSFDGLEWCQTAIDSSLCRLHHFQHSDLFNDGVRTAKEELFTPLTLASNLFFYSEHMSMIRKLLKNNRLIAKAKEEVRRHFTPRVAKEIASCLA